MSHPSTTSASASMTIPPAEPASSAIPVFRTLSDIYHSPDGEKARWEQLVNTFKERHGREPSHIIRAAGRLCMLGEHVDYSLFPVLPMAIEQDILFAISPSASTNSPAINISNVQIRFTPASFPLLYDKATGAWDVEITSFAGWESYMKAVLKQGLATYFDGSDEGKEPRGMDIVVSGNVPPGSGLSSSAAFVVAGMLSFLTINGLADQHGVNDLVQLAMASEHRMGVQTGGMDQAASVLGRKSSLLHISFHPSLSCSSVSISPSLAIVITNSMAPHSLGDSAERQYNLRVVETCLAARLLAHAWGLSEHPVVKVESKARVRLMEVLALHAEQEAKVGKGTKGVEELLADVTRILGKAGRGEEGWTKEEIARESGMSEADFDRVYFQTFLKVRADKFLLLRRVRHILLENARVERFCHLSQASSSSSTSDPDASASPETISKLGAELGALLNATHASCKGDYDCTVPQTDALQELCVELGSLGSRQTGGGWGGAVISLVKVEEADAFLQRVKEAYGPYQGMSKAEVEQNAFITRPGTGAGVYTYDGQIHI